MIVMIFIEKIYILTPRGSILFCTLNSIFTSGSTKNAEMQHSTCCLLELLMQSATVLLSSDM